VLRSLSRGGFFFVNYALYSSSIRAVMLDVAAHFILFDIDYPRRDGYTWHDDTNGTK
jgi:hypothetical protein